MHLYGFFNEFFFSLKTIQLEKLKLRIVNQVENSDAEEKMLAGKIPPIFIASQLNSFPDSFE